MAGSTRAAPAVAGPMCTDSHDPLWRTARDCRLDGSHVGGAWADERHHLFDIQQRRKGVRGRPTDRVGKEIRVVPVTAMTYPQGVKIRGLPASNVQNWIITQHPRPCSIGSQTRDRRVEDPSLWFPDADTVRNPPSVDQIGDTGRPQLESPRRVPRLDVYRNYATPLAPNAL